MRSPGTRRLAALLVAAALAAAAAPTTQPGYTTPDGEIRFLESRAWFAAGESAVANLDQEQGDWIQWVDTAPTDDTGALLLTAGPVSPLRQNLHGDDARHKTQFTAVGTHTGHLDSLALDLHFLRPHAGAPCYLDTDVELSVGVDLLIDGVTVLDMGSDDGFSSYVPVTVEETPAGYVARLKVINLHERMAADGLTGDETATHDLRVAVQQFYLCEEVLWRYDSTEAPSSILFNRNPADTSVADHTTIDATDPPPRDPPTLVPPELPDLP